MVRRNSSEVCRRCFRRVERKDSELCEGCIESDQKRKEDAKNAVCGGLSCSPEYELEEVPTTPPSKTPRPIGMRSDVRWYKKSDPES